jgi:hypothetical protein
MPFASLEASDVVCGRVMPGVRLLESFLTSAYEELSAPV